MSSFVITPIISQKPISSACFPELSDPRYSPSKNVGVSLSGGGPRSLSCCLGQLRGLHAIGLIDNVGVISAVSGGSWFGTLYSFASSEIPNEKLLGEVIPPEKLTKLEVELPFHSQCIGHVVPHFTNVKMLFSIGESICKKLPVTYYYARILNDLILKPFGLDDTSKHFTLDLHSFLALKANNPELKKEDFYFMRKNPTFGTPLPYFSATNTLNYPIGPDAPINNVYHFEMTPLYVGTAQQLQLQVNDANVVFGGGFIPPLAFNFPPAGQTPTSNSNGTVNVSQSSALQFTLSDVIGSSGAAYGSAIDDMYPKLSIVSPAFNYFPPSIDHPEIQASINYHFVDGGNLEGTGIAALLQRQFTNIIAFINTGYALGTESSATFEGVDGLVTRLFGFPPTSKPHKSDFEEIPQFNSVSDYLEFEHKSKSKDHSKLYDGVPTKKSNSTHASHPFPDTQIFHKEKFHSLKKAFFEAKAHHKAIIHKDTYEIMPNNYFGIHQPNPVTILWVYNDINGEWKNALSKDLQGILNDTSADNYMANFPNYKTVCQNKFLDIPEILLLTTRQVKLLANMHCYTITSNSKLFKSMVPEVLHN